MTAHRFQTVAWWVLGVTLAAFAFGLRVYHLGVPNLTNDEWFMLRNHDQGPLWIIHQAHTFEPHPLLYYLGLAGWIEVAGRSEVAMRFPSVVFGVLLVTVVIGLGRALVDRWAGLIAGALVALNPYQIVESQNARNYAMVVSLSALASLLFVRALKRSHPRDWIAYGLAMVLALNTHLEAALVLLVHVVYAVVVWRTRLGPGSSPAVTSSPVPAGAAGESVISPRRLRLGWLIGRDRVQASGLICPRGWLLTTGTVVVLLVAWLLYALPALRAYHGYFPERVGVERVLARSLATFTLGDAASIRQALPAFALAVIGGCWLVARKTRTALFLGLYSLLPIATVSLLFIVRPMFDERYLIVLAPGYLLVLAAGLDGLLRMAWPIGVLGLVGALILFAPALPRTYQEMLTDRADYRAMAAWIATDGEPDDPIVATGFGQAELFGYYAGGSRQARVIDQPADLASTLPSLLRDHDGLWLLPYWHNAADETALRVLSQVAAPAAERWFVNTRALYYASPRRLTTASPVRATWDDRIQLESASVTGGVVEPGAAAAAELRWRVTAAVATPKLSLRLLDASGTPIVQSDVPLVSDDGVEPGEILTRAGLLVPPVTPPGRYALAIVLYRPDSGAPLALSTASLVQDGALVLGWVEVGARERPVPPSEADVKLSTPVTFQAGISLLGHDPLGGPRPAGGWLSFRLLWRSDRPGLPALERTLTLRDRQGHDTVVLRGPILPAYPTSRWSRGQMLADRIQLQVPPTTLSGTYHLVLSVGAGGTTADLGDVVISGPNRSFTRPPFSHPIAARFGSFATLLGDGVVPTRARPGDSIQVTLVWEARGTADRSYSAFVHLLDPNGKIRGQVDQVPMDGSRPTDGWVAGEYLTDDYRPRLDADAPAGEYQIEVGLYDARTGARVPVALADGGRSDHVTIGTFWVGGPT